MFVCKRQTGIHIHEVGEFVVTPTVEVLALINFFVAGRGRAVDGLAKWWPGKS